MFKGTRQTLAIIAALLDDPAVLILDEPTSGLDPLMKQVFIEIMHEEHERGKTIFLSSHTFFRSRTYLSVIAWRSLRQEKLLP